MARTSIYLKASRTNDDGTAPLYLRLSHNGNDRLVSLGLRLKPSHWSKRRQEATSAAPGADRINEALARATTTGKQAIAEAAAAAGGSLGSVHVDDIRERAERRLHPEREATDATPSNPERTDLIAYGRRLADRLENEGRIATARAYKTALKKVSLFVVEGRNQNRGATLPFAALTPDFVERFRAWLASPAPHGLGLSPNTVHKHITSIARMWRLAERDGVLDQGGRAPTDPFRRVVVKRVPTRRAKLSAEEVRAIEAVDLTEASLKLARDAWVLALYAGGMRFSDVATLQRQHVTRSPGGDYRIAYRMKKTKGITSLRLAPPGVAIMERFWDQRDLGEASPKTWVLPLIDHYDTSTPKKTFNAIASQNALMNRRLKAVQAAAEAGLGRKMTAPLTFHLARHSLAGRLLEMGWDVYDIRTALGHANVRVTEEYLRGFGRPDLDERMGALF